jgi:hypothetical protein
MTKKHYEAIAAAFHAYISTNTGTNIAKPIAKDLADYFAAENPKFDRERFLAACGITHKEGCGHLAGTAIYKNGKLLGKKCHNCGDLVKLPNQRSQT